MPFHAGGHKPKAKLPVSAVKVRLQLVACAVPFLALGIVRLSHGIHVVLNCQAMPMYSAALVGTGLTFLLLAIIPFSWLDRIAQRLDTGRRKPEIPLHRP
jgi:hypothetical protein